MTISVMMVNQAEVSCRSTHLSCQVLDLDICSIFVLQQMGTAEDLCM